MKLTSKSLCLPFGASNIPVLILTIHRLAQYWISQSLLLWLLILTICIWRKFNSGEGGIIGRLGVTAIGGYLMERDVWRWFSGTAMTVRLGLVGVTNTVNIMAVTALYHIMNHLFLYLDMFDVWLVHNNDDYIGYQLAGMMTFMPKRLYKSHNLTAPLLC